MSNNKPEKFDLEYCACRAYIAAANAEECACKARDYASDGESFEAFQYAALAAEYAIDAESNSRKIIDYARRIKNKTETGESK